MNSIAGRVVYKLFAENVFVSSITFHGGTNSITYPWGSNNHISTADKSKGAEAPDHVALDTLGDILVDQSGPSFNTSSGYSVQKYASGDMTSVVYPVGGGLEDWSYGCGWDLVPGATLASCTPYTYSIDSTFFTAQTTNHISTAMYLIEMDRSKSPPEESYGSRDIIINSQGS